MSVHEARVYGKADVTAHGGIIFFPQNKSLNNYLKFGMRSVPYSLWPHIFSGYHLMWGHAVVQLVEALRYKPESRGFDYR
jgi:hypothetical protein